MGAAALMSLAPLQTLFFIDVVTASIAIIILYALVKVPVKSKKIQKQVQDDIGCRQDEDIKSPSHFAELIDGLKYIKSQKYLLQLIIVSTCFMVAMAPPHLTPLQTTRNFGPEL